QPVGLASYRLAPEAPAIEPVEKQKVDIGALRHPGEEESEVLAEDWIGGESPPAFENDLEPIVRAERIADDLVRGEDLAPGGEEFPIAHPDPQVRQRTAQPRTQHH